MALRNVIIIKKPGELISKGYLERVVKEYTSYMGTALVFDGQLIVDHKKGRPTVDAIMELQSAEGFIDKQILFCFGENSLTMPDEDMQPFPVDIGGGNIIALGMEGNFEGYSVPKSAHTNTFHCKEDALQKKLQKLFKAGGSTIEGFLEELNDPITLQDISNFWTDRGYISIMTTAGGVKSVFNKGHVFKSSYNWGDTSSSLNYVEQTITKEEKVVEKPMSALEKLKSRIAGGPAKPDGLVEKKGDTAISIDLNNLEDVRLPPEAFDAVGGWTNKQKAQWWINELGYQPPGYKDMITICKRTKGTRVGIAHPLASSNVKDAATAGDPVADKALTNNEVKNLTDKNAPEGVKDTTAHHITVDNMPILSPKQKLNLKSNWMKDADIVKLLGDDHRALMNDPKKLGEFIDNYQAFTDGLGISDDTWLSFEALMKLGATDLKALAIYAFNRQNDNSSANIRLKSILSNPNNKLDRAAM